MIKPRLTIMINLFLLLNLGMFIFGCSDDEEKETQEQEIQQLVKELGGGDGMIRTYATVALSRMGEPAVPALIEALNHQDVGVRWNAVVALNMMGKPAKLAVSALIKSLEDEHKEIRATAAGALAKIGTPKAKEALVEFVPTLLQSLSEDNAG
ncbi:MAG: HEAT repeat domain-containing protein, partial [Candidatus Poribacteria bacterium]|nr:HEAT repeat domain-containing protein [Candidatus Poribacteria bacterium]